jgi:hypothetical protein
VTVEVTRARLGSVVEWMIAAACILAALGVGAVGVRELRTVPALTPVIAEAAPIPEPPPAVPSRAVSIPMLVLATGVQLRVGEHATAVAARLDPAWQVGTDALERRGDGERLTRTYDDGVTHFLIVFDRPVPGADLRVSAIYVQ